MGTGLLAAGSTAGSSATLSTCAGCADGRNVVRDVCLTSGVMVWGCGGDSLNLSGDCVLEVLPEDMDKGDAIELRADLFLLTLRCGDTSFRSGVGERRLAGERPDMMRNESRELCEKATYDHRGI